MSDDLTDDEYMDREEWWQVAKLVKPELTWIEFYEQWREFIKMKRDRIAKAVDR